MDKFQERYLAHQKRKVDLIDNQNRIEHFDSENLRDVLRQRRSRRIYNGESITEKELKEILLYASYAPSSCNRKAIEAVDSKDNIDKLVGGKNWIDKADKVLLIYANMLAYKSPNEVDFMPYLDTGFFCQNIYLICEVLNINCCFVNPNSTDDSLEIEGKRFCGAIALGK